MYWRALILTLTVILPLPAAEPAKMYEVETKKDVAYRDGDGADPVRHKLDLYLPKDCKDYPVLFFIHGGAWSVGSKNDFGLYAGLGKALAKQGIGMVSINYRLSPKVQHPAHIEDVAAAFAWVHAHIGAYGANPDRMFVCGHSAGGHLCALLASDDSYLKKQGLDGKAIKGAIPVSGVFYIGPGILKNVFGTDAEVRKLAQPAEHVKAGLPPFLILYADRDLPGGDGKQAERFCARLRDKGVEATSREFKDSDHIRIMLSVCNPKDDVFAAVRDFIVRHAR